MLKEEGDEVVFMCRDFGIGIPSDDQKKVFEPFFRGSNAVQHQAGTGLGLYIVKKMADLYGYRVWFTSTEKNGTHFYVAMPKVC